MNKKLKNARKKHRRNVKRVKAKQRAAREGARKRM